MAFLFWRLTTRSQNIFCQLQSQNKIVGCADLFPGPGRMKRSLDNEEKYGRVDGTSSSTLVSRHSHMNGEEQYVYFVTFLGDEKHFASAGSDHAIRMFGNKSPLLLYQHANVITCLKYIASLRSLVSSSLDGTVSIVHFSEDHVIQSKRVIQSKSRGGLLWFDLDPKREILAVCTPLVGDEARIEFFDLSSGKPKAYYSESHSDDITQCVYHPRDPNMLLSAGVDGLLVLYDSRISDEDDAVNAVINSGSSVQRAGFFTSPDMIYALSTMETLTLWTMDGECRHDFGDLRTTLSWANRWKTDYVIEILPKVVQSTHAAPISDSFYLCVGNNQGEAAIVKAEQSSEGSVTLQLTLPAHNVKTSGDEEHEVEIIRTVSIYDKSDEESPYLRILTGSESGALTTWHCSMSNLNATSSAASARSTKKSRVSPLSGAPIAN